MAERVAEAWENQQLGRAPTVVPGDQSHRKSIQNQDIATSNKVYNETRSKTNVTSDSDFSSSATSAIKLQNKSVNKINAATDSTNILKSETGVYSDTTIMAAGNIKIKGSKIKGGIDATASTGSTTQQSGATVDQSVTAKQKAAAKAKAAAKLAMDLQQDMSAAAKNESKFTNKQTAKSEGSQSMITGDTQTIMMVIVGLAVIGGLYWYNTKDKKPTGPPGAIPGPPPGYPTGYPGPPPGYPPGTMAPPQGPYVPRKVAWGNIFNL
jgi:LPXTG-motif cell wall-anchored protein